MSRLKNAVQKVAISNGLASGRVLISCEELAKKYPEGVHVTAIAPKKYEDGDYYQLLCVEEPGKYFSSGKVLTQKCDALLETYDGNFFELNKDLSEDYLQLFLAVKRSSETKYDYVDAGFGEAVPAKKFKTDAAETTADAEVIDEETGEVLQPAQPATITQDGEPF